MRQSFNIYLLSLLTSCFVTKATAQQLSLPDAINIALKNNLDIQLVKNEMAIANINNHIGVAGGLPSVNAVANDAESITSVNQKLNNGTIIERKGASANNLNANVTASQIVYNGMRIVATKKRLQEIALLTKLQLNSAIQNTISAVMLKYYDIVRQQNYATTITQSIEVINKQLELIEVRKSVGLANNADLFQAKLDVNALQQSLQSQQLVIDNAKADLLALLYLKQDSAVQITDTIVADASINIAEITNAIQQNADVLSASQNIKISELLVKEVAAQRYPTLRANAGINYNRNQSEAGFTLLNQTYGPSLGLGLAIPIYNGSAFKRQQQVANINLSSAKLNRDILLNNITTEVVKNYQAYINVLNRIAKEKENLQLSKQLLALTMQRYELRVATIIEYREAQRSFIDAGYRLTNLSFAAKVAEIELKRLANQLTF